MKERGGDGGRRQFTLQCELLHRPSLCERCKAVIARPRTLLPAFHWQVYPGGVL